MTGEIFYKPNECYKNIYYLSWHLLIFIMRHTAVVRGTRTIFLINRRPKYVLKKNSLMLICKTQRMVCVPRTKPMILFYKQCFSELTS